MTAPASHTAAHVGRATTVEVELAQATEERARVVEAADRRWRAAIVAALEAGIGATEVGRLAGISRERVYQIRDGRR